MDKIKYIKTAECKTSGRLNFKNVIKNVFFSLVVVTIMLLLCATVFTYSDLNIKYLSFVSKIIMYIGAVTTGVFSGFRAKNNGWLSGGTASAIYILCLVIVKFLLIPDKTLGISSVITFASVMLSGAIGGIIGINIKK